MSHLFLPHEILRMETPGQAHDSSDQVCLSLSVSLSILCCGTCVRGAPTSVRSCVLPWLRAVVTLALRTHAELLTDLRARGLVGGGSSSSPPPAPRRGKSVATPRCGVRCVLLGGRFD
jgi:hypothetical protein